MHTDALRLDPRAYLAAAWWRLTGKKLRARLMLAPLLGQSRWAYRVWQASDGQPRATPASSPPITALVMPGEGQELTLASLEREGISAEMVDEVPSGSERGWYLPVASGDILARGAGNTYRGAATNVPDTAYVVYADDDLLDARGFHYHPHFKPGWNGELFRHFDYLTGAAIMRLDPADFADLPKHDWAEALMRRAVSHSTDNPVHVPRILHHRRQRPKPQRPPAMELSKEHMAALPSISVIVPTRNRLDLLRTCLEGFRRTEYSAPLEILVIDNGSDDPATLEYLASLDPAFARVLPMPGPFNFSALNNRAVEHASGELLCFLNNDIEIGDPHWLAVLATQALRDDVGAVGARLLYPDGRIQHAGVVLGIGGGAAHAHRLLAPDEEGYFHRHALPQFVSAVTAACMVVRKERFLAVGGFDADRLAVAFNDVDLCLKLNARGWRSLYEPRATLVHHESVSRGFDRDAAGARRLAAELATLQDRWAIAEPDPGTDWHHRQADPFHHPALSPFSERFVLLV